jgi:hypothetical protein
MIVFASPLKRDDRWKFWNYVSDAFGNILGAVGVRVSDNAGMKGIRRQPVAGVGRPSWLIVRSPARYQESVQRASFLWRIIKIKSTRESVGRRGELR